MGKGTINFTVRRVCRSKGPVPNILRKQSLVWGRKDEKIKVNDGHRK